ncbi:MAG: M20/M25/M40 family metallo-hydrolase, partial [Anaerolineales bacterium]|nr:M20/M25/M40 family metallo-hydrolase [Anaerolineales bacterium]
MTTDQIDQLLADCVDFTQRLIQTPSMTHEEETIAHLIADELRALGYDEVWLDELHNVYGRVYGQDRTLPALALNAHTDHVDPGDPALWPVPPFSGEIVEGRICGRGACDIKGPLAVQVYSVAGLLRNGERPRRDVVFCGVVEEEIGGTGARYWAKNLDYPVELCLLAEPSDNQLALGHRGIWGVWVKFHGRSVHASAPQRGENPNYYLATFLERLPDHIKNLPEHPYLGATTISPTIIEVDTTS